MPKPVNKKKKFTNRNSIGRARKHVGVASNYITRNQAVKKLQISLKDFRRLCILKGIYPRLPHKKPEGSNKTYYYAKDIAYLAHEPMLHHFRSTKAFLKKLQRAVGRKEENLAKHIADRQPTQTLDHIVKERYPSFVDALRDLDDALCMLHLFASFPTTEHVPQPRTHNCARLCREFQIYVAKTGAIRKTFVSIKGVYYQANVHGVDLTWIVPHQFSQEMPMDVDYRIMLTFLEFYETLMNFINFKLFHSNGWVYPPPLDTNLDAQGGWLSAILLQQKPTSSTCAAITESSSEEHSAPLSSEQKKSLKKVIRKLPAATSADGATEAGAAAEEEKEKVDEMVDEESQLYKTLFAGKLFFLNREVPRTSLELVLVSCGALLTSDNSAAVTHMVVDRELKQDSMLLDREYVQPQWVYDCINMRSLLPTHPYRPGVHCPAHLSPFVDDSKEDYVPEQRQWLQSLAQGNVEDVDQMGDEDENEDGADNKEEEEDEVRYKKGLQAERSGASFSAAPAKKAAQKSEARKQEQEQEQKQLAIQMMPKKDRYLYNKMQYGIDARKKQADNLTIKKRQLEESGAVATTKKKQKKVKGKGKA